MVNPYHPNPSPDMVGKNKNSRHYFWSDPLPTPSPKNTYNSTGIIKVVNLPCDIMQKWKTIKRFIISTLFHCVLVQRHYGAFKKGNIHPT